MICDGQSFEDIFTKDQLINYSMNCKGVCRTAMATLVLLIRISNIRNKDFRACMLCYNAQGTPLDFETGWTGELWSKAQLAKLIK